MSPARLEPRPLLRRPLVIAFWVLVLVGAARLISAAAAALFVGFLGVLLAILFSYPTRLLSKAMPRGLAVIVTVVAFCGVLVGIGFASIPALADQAGHLVEQIPKAAARFDAWVLHVEQHTAFSRMAGGGEVAASLMQRATELASSLVSHTIPAALTVVEAVSGAVLLVILAAFLVHRPASYAEALRSLVPREHEDTFDEVWRRLQAGLGHWVAGTIASMTVMGLLTAAGTWAIGLQGWSMLGAITFLATSVPYLGAIASAIPGLILGLAMDPAHFVYALLVYSGVHVVEGYVVQPLVMNRAVALRPGFLLFWQFLMAAAFGIPGIIVATPLLVTAKVAGGYLWIERRLGKPAPEV
jgi:predicted PurR-regulated permease PerM